MQHGTNTNWMFLNIVLKIHLNFPGQREISFWLCPPFFLTLYPHLLGNFFFLAMQHSMWDLSSPTRNWTHDPCSGSTRVLTIGPSPGSPLFCSLDLSSISPFPQPPILSTLLCKGIYVSFPAFLKKRKKPTSTIYISRLKTVKMFW